MTVWKLIYERDHSIEYFSTKKKLLKELNKKSNAKKAEEGHKAHKIWVKNSDDLVFQLKVAQRSSPGS
tara:strand:- start:11654 stop:11857 length:204 start_codon:yes stop_codon:yes gene_type:complete